MTDLAALDAFWADVRAKANKLEADIAAAVDEADRLILDLTRARMVAEK